MKKTYITLTIVGFVLLIAVLTNPDQNRHKEVIKEKLNSYLQQSMDENTTDAENKWEQAGQAFGMMLGGAMIDGIVNNVITTNNYVLFSTTKIAWQDDSKIIGVGIFGNVFLTKKLDEALEEGLLGK